eukprot:TRINITY_DN1489_c0_g1_i3.p1 TRINITY_DN1489_c0_g1~~TRINITY_DN1489_c0_g1_i3.p1  ORF type:complete len:282 (-),score=56.15 TRINITY_DN1489_c0_g1_i3:26-871(-)
MIRGEEQPPEDGWEVDGESLILSYGSSSVVLFTDFGGGSEYVGVMKGVLLRQLCASRVPIVDLFHDVAPQSVLNGAWILSCNYKFFPAYSVFLCVVDPGVGSSRQVVAVQTNHFVFVGPNNGLFTKAVVEDGFVRAVCLDTTASPSTTFHGRDIFAPAAALVARHGFTACNGAPLLAAELVPSPLQSCTETSGEVVHIDRFGNIITDIVHATRASDSQWLVCCGSTTLEMRQCRTYAEADSSLKLFLIVGSSNTWEVSVKNGNAAAAVHVAVGMQISVTPV